MKAPVGRFILPSRSKGNEMKTRMPEENERGLARDQKLYPPESKPGDEPLNGYQFRQGELFAQQEELFAPGIQQFPLIHLRPNTHCPRHIEDDGALERLTESIRHRGVVVPILVRPLTTAYDPAEGGEYEIICGHRRVAAAKRAGLRTVRGIQCLIFDDEEAFELQVVDNTHRENLHPLDEAEAFRTVYEVVRSGPEESTDQAQKALELTARRLGKPPQFVAQRMELNDLIDAAKEQFRNGSILLGDALELARLGPHEQAEAMKRLVNASSSV
jgi:ParB family transcriptional regulator, chromosome partitioning protein